MIKLIRRLFGSCQHNPGPASYRTEDGFFQTDCSRCGVTMRLERTCHYYTHEDMKRRASDAAAKHPQFVPGKAQKYPTPWKSEPETNPKIVQGRFGAR